MEIRKMQEGKGLIMEIDGRLDTNAAPKLLE